MPQVQISLLSRSDLPRSLSNSIFLTFPCDLGSFLCIRTLNRRIQAVDVDPIIFLKIIFFFSRSLPRNYLFSLGSGIFFWVSHDSSGSLPCLRSKSLSSVDLIYHFLSLTVSLSLFRGIWTLYSAKITVLGNSSYPHRSNAQSRHHLFSLSRYYHLCFFLLRVIASPHVQTSFSLNSISPFRSLSSVRFGFFLSTHLITRLGNSSRRH